jgi:hypothetical protein
MDAKFLYSFHIVIYWANCMVLEEETKILQSRNAHTQYIVIPAAMVRDSQYPFKADERVRITVDPYRKIMIIKSVDEPTAEVVEK